MNNLNIKDNHHNKPQTLLIDFVVVGFGASGIATSIELKKKGIGFIVLEKRDTYGGCWNDALETSTLQTHKDCYKFVDLEYDKSAGDFPNKRDILNYFEKAINHFKIKKHVMFNVEFNLEKSNTLWLIKLNTGTQIQCKHILFCLGTNCKPSIPYINIHNENKNNMISIHSNKFNLFTKSNPKYFYSKRKIVIVGNGASCCDILKNIKDSNQQHEIMVMFKSPKFFLPKYIFGIPCHYFLTKPLLCFFENTSLTINILLLTLANMIFIHNYLDIPFSKINSFNIIASFVIQDLMSKGILSYHQESIKEVDLKRKIIKTDESLYTDIDMIIYATGYSEIDFESSFNINFDYLYNYVLPIKVNKDLDNKLNIGFIGLNRTYNFLLNSQSKAKWYIDNVYLDFKVKNEDITKWIKQTINRKKKNNLKFLDSTYELFEIEYT